MKKPNFFIVGAPKCGTTSVASWLKQHPDVFIPSVKEPHHFNTDRKDVGIASREDYEKLFSGAQSNQVAVGEASVWYLYSDSAFENIERYSPGARYIVCVRNPVEVVYSLHEQLVFNVLEDIPTFEDAWSAQEARARGEKLPAHYEEIRQHLYGDVGKLGKRLGEVYSLVDRDRIHVMVLDDIQNDPEGEFYKVCQFLDVDTSFKPDFQVKNTAKERRSQLAQRLVRSLWKLKKLVRIPANFGVLTKLSEMNTHYRARQPMNEDTRQELKQYFRADVALLGESLNRDLSHWVD